MVLRVEPVKVEDTTIANQLFESALKHKFPLFQRIGLFIWTMTGITGLTAFAFLEPFSDMLFTNL